MIVKAKISSINDGANTAEVILLEYDNIITAPVPFLHSYSLYSIGQFVVLAIFNNDFNDAIIL